MAKRKAGRAARRTPQGRKRMAATSSAKRSNKKAKPAGKKAKPAPKAKARKTAASSKRTGARKVAKRAARRLPRKITRPSATNPVSATRPKAPGLDRVRRTLDDPPATTPPSALNMDRHGSAARTGRAELMERLENHKSMGTDIAGGDVDVDLEDAYFTGDEAPGGDNSTPDQDIVDDIGKALGVVYQDDEELKAADKVIERDRNRWELDPASAEDYKERK
jgi:hypothetical protein